jgi:hypothetical protein
MPLLDHFHPPLSERRPWESFHTTWASVLADMLNQDVLPPGYIALEHVHPGAALEIDVATFADEAEPTSDGTGGTTTVARTVWVPATAPLVFPAVFPPSATVEVLSTEGGRTLVAAIELVSPGNKDRSAKRRLFAAKCATYLSRGVGLVIVDVITSRRGNLHNDLADLLELDAAFRMPAEESLYTVAYRPLRAADSEQVEAWPNVLAVGQVLPAVPLSLGADWCVRVDLEAGYLEACRRRRVDEVVGGAAG